MRRIGSIVILMTLILGLAGCASDSGRPARAVEALLEALVTRQEARFTSLTCPDYEAQALIEFDSFALVKSELKGVACSVTESDSEGALVHCTGSIEATYGAELRSFDLTARTYRVVPSGGDWLVCGYTK
jgi:hypothetical protein